MDRCIFQYLEDAKNGKRRQYIQPLAGAAQVPRNVAFAAPIAAPGKLRQREFFSFHFSPSPHRTVAVMAAAPVAFQPAVVAPTGQCPGGPSLPIECDPKRPWPQCPPQSYCYATNSVDIGPYFCCPVCEFRSLRLSYHLAQVAEKVPSNAVVQGRPTEPRGDLPLHSTTTYLRCQPTGLT